mmetsp:Transcript_21720/g.68041  ORF Transcript_21720/g.68041 Transcript_21720/m.68041 type:complete len:212 (+) Transcript_21720:406-1041(+)
MAPNLETRPPRPRRPQFREFSVSSRSSFCGSCADWTRLSRNPSSPDLAVRSAFFTFASTAARRNAAFSAFASASSSGDDRARTHRGVVLCPDRVTNASPDCDERTRTPSHATIVGMTLWARVWDTGHPSEVGAASHDGSSAAREPRMMMRRRRSPEAAAAGAALGEAAEEEGPAPREHVAGAALSTCCRRRRKTFWRGARCHRRVPRCRGG